MTRALGIDFGTVRIGLAVSDESKTIAREYGILKPADFWKQAAAILKVQEVDDVVVGLPVGMSGDDTDKTVEVRKFIDRLQSSLRIKVKTSDERLSSVMAESISGTKKNIDSLAAQILLQNWLDRRAHGKNSE